MYKLTITQAQSLFGKKYDNEQYFNAIVDINGDYFISKEEIDHCTNYEFQWVKTLSAFDFVAPIPVDAF